MKRFNRYLLACALALAVLLGQHAAALHALGHAVDSVTQNDKAPAPAKCPDHSLFSTLGAALGSDAPVTPVVAAVCVTASTPILASAALAPRFSFLSRAPPALS